VSDYGLYVTAVEKQQLVACADILADPTVTRMEREEALSWGYRATVDVPLISKADVIGFVSLYNRAPRPFEREDVVLGLAQVASQAIANARLYEKLDDNLRRMALVSESALELASSLELQDTLLATARRLCLAARKKRRGWMNGWSRKNGVPFPA